LLLIGLLLAGSRPPIRARRTAVRVILVTSWIALVGGYVFPIHLREATTSRKADCLSNVKKLALALLRYGDDHHGRLPEASSWYDELLGTYVKDADIFRCAEAPDLTLAYSLNPALSGVDLRDIEDRESLILVFECDSPRHVEGSPGLLPAEPRHYGGDNYGFADGHAVWGGRARLAEQGRGEVIWGSRPADDRWRWEPSPRREEDG
jgi:prepilin-type processing-associated H-X9-DG protein